MRHVKTALISVALTAVMLSLVGISSADRAAYKTCADVAAIDISGTYDSNWGVVQLRQSGDSVTGKYECCGGGTITGTIVDGVIEYRWDQQGASGNGVWAIPHKTGRMIGTWGSGGSDVNGGGWNLAASAATAAIAK